MNLLLRLGSVLLEQSQIDLLLILLAFFMSLLLVAFSIRPLVRIALAKHLVEELNERKIHKKAVPSIGGVAIFIGVTLSAIISTNGYSFDVLKYIIAAIILMFFVGLKDDITIISAKKKIVFQIVAAIILFLLGDIRITNFQGLFGIEEVSYGVSAISSVFLIVVILNSFNFIDGVDGLASGIAIIASVVFGTWFYLAGYIQYAILCFSLSGSLTAFFYYNVFGKANKLFMGDSGSLIIGIVLSVAAIKFIELNNIQDGNYAIYAAPAVAFSILIVPLADLFKVFFIRIYNRRSPFTPDNNHFHHYLLIIKKNHFVTTLITMSINILFIVFALGLSVAGLNVNVLFGILFLMAFIVVNIPYLLLPKKKKTIYRYLYERLRKIASLFY